MTTLDNDKNEADSTRQRMDNLSEEKRRLLEKMMAKERTSRTQSPSGPSNRGPAPSTGGHAGSTWPGTQSASGAFAQSQAPHQAHNGWTPPGTADPMQNPFFGHSAGAPQNPWAGLSQAGGTEGDPFSSAGFFKNGQGSTGPGSSTAAGPPPVSPLIAMKPGGTRPPLFCVHALFGSVFPYHNLTLHLEEDQPFYGLQAGGLDGMSAPLESIEEMAETYIREIRKIQPHGPYYLGGYSFGGLVAFEMAQQLLKQGEKIDFLGIFGTIAPISNLNPELLERFQYIQEYISHFQKLVLNSFLADEIRMNMSGQEMQGQSPLSKLPVSPILKVFKANCCAQIKYRPEPYPGKIKLFITRELRELFFIDPSLGWKMMCSEGDITLVTGNHFNTFQEPHVRDLASKLTLCLKAAVNEAAGCPN